MCFQQRLRTGTVILTPHSLRKLTHRLTHFPPRFLPRSQHLGHSWPTIKQINSSSNIKALVQSMRWRQYIFTTETFYKVQLNGSQTWRGISSLPCRTLKPTDSLLFLFLYYMVPKYGISSISFLSPSSKILIIFIVTSLRHYSGLCLWNEFNLISTTA